MKTHECAAPVCVDCHTSKLADQYQKGKKFCKDCGRIRLQVWRANNPEKRKAQRVGEYERYNTTIRRCAKNYYEANKELVSEKAKAKYLETDNFFVNLKRQERYQVDKEFRDVTRAANSAYSRRVRKAKPKWVKRHDLLPFYLEAQRLTEETGILHSVDHIIPLNGVDVSGLHVPGNLQVLTLSENSRKSNSFTG